MNKKLVEFIEIAIMGALAFALGYVKVYSMPNGGSVSLEMLPVIIMAFRRGPRAGLITGLLLAGLQAMFGGYIIGVVQGFLDYFFAFGVIGLASIFGKSTRVQVTLGILVVTFLRFFAHVLTGVYFWEVDWAGSIAYNGPYMLGSTVLVVAVTLALFGRKEIFEA
jgi:thiamine transporter